MGSKAYELADHLSNVTVTVSDLKRELPNTDLALHGITAPLGMDEKAYAAQVLSYTNYYAFGMSMPGRNKTSEGYRYGFNGKENDKEWGTGLIQDYGFRLYNPTLAKFLSVDPLTSSYPALTPYQFASNQPIESVDLDGMERLDYKLTLDQGGGATLKKTGYLPAKYQSDSWYSFMVPEMDIPPHVRVEYNGQFYIFADAGVHNALKKVKVDGRDVIGAENPYTKQDLQKFIKNPDAFATNRESENASYLKVAADQASILHSSIVESTAGMRRTAPNLTKIPKELRELIVDENLSPMVSEKLVKLGFKIKVFIKGTTDSEIIEYAQKTSAVVMTNNIKDFKNKGITTLEVPEKLKAKSEVGNLVDKVLNVSNKSIKDPTILEPGKNVKLREH